MFPFLSLLSWVDHRDSSLCRSDAELRNRFAEGGFGLVAQQQQQDWPDSLLPVDCQQLFFLLETVHVIEDHLILSILATETWPIRQNICVLPR